MEQEFQCTKIKDGLYLGNLTAIQDYEFLQINKFSYIINCAAQVPNYFDNHGIKYLKFKLVKERTHKLWDQNLKKLRKLEKFIEEAEEQSLCCLIFSHSGNNRSLVMLTAYLMSRYRWTLSKSLQYIRSKKIYIGLTEHYIDQLESLEKMLGQQEKPKLSNGWNGPYTSQEENLIAKTYLNSQELPVQIGEKKPKKQKRVVWQDRIEKQKKKQNRSNRLKQTALQNTKKSKSTHKIAEEPNHPVNSLSSKTLKHQTIQSPLKRPEGTKKIKKCKTSSIRMVEAKLKQNFQEFQQSRQIESLVEKQKLMQESKNGYLSQKELFNLMNKKIKSKKDMILKQDRGEDEDIKDIEKGVGIYKLTINNFIAPNINIINGVSKEKNSKSCSRKIKKENRTKSEKQSAKGQPPQFIRQHQTKLKKGNQNSPTKKEKQSDKPVSLQIKKIN